MAEALLEIAGRAAARAVTAHTLPLDSASGAVLRKAGFAFRGPAEDPEDGPVWAWRRRLR
jgi:RimJ/RimL family protein N-acetyltransferase